MTVDDQKLPHHSPSLVVSSVRCWQWLTTILCCAIMELPLLNVYCILSLSVFHSIVEDHSLSLSASVSLFLLLRGDLNC